MAVSGEGVAADAHQLEAGMINLGGSSLFLGDDVGFGSRESVADFGPVLSQYVNIVVVRAFRHQTAINSHYCTCAVINGLTDQAHPCQAWPISTRSRNWSAAWPDTRWRMLATAIT